MIVMLQITSDCKDTQLCRNVVPNLTFCVLWGGGGGGVSVSNTLVHNGTRSRCIATVPLFALFTYEFLPGNIEVDN
jgi:hypothetical protein